MPRRGTLNVENSRIRHFFNRNSKGSCILGVNPVFFSKNLVREAAFHNILQGNLFEVLSKKGVRMFPETMGRTDIFSPAGVAVIKCARRKMQFFTYSLENIGNSYFAQFFYQLKTSSWAPGRLNQPCLSKTKENLLQKFCRNILDFRECTD